MKATLKHIATTARLIEATDKLGDYTKQGLRTDLYLLKDLVEKAMEETRTDR